MPLCIKNLLPCTSPARLQIARDPASVDADPDLRETLKFKISRHADLEATKNKTVLYLAYGSNLSVETFRGNRGIEPISQVNVYVPELRLTFDLAGLPYIEPCFSGSQYRSTEKSISQDDNVFNDEKQKKEDEETSLLNIESGSDRKYHKDQWHKPLIGVVYEVTLKDYAHIIATEGAGSGYKDVVVPCFPFSKDYNPNDPTPNEPDTEPFMAHTLLSPSKSDYGKQSHRIRADPSYAQPSARYLKLLTDGASELDLPHDYRAYLASIRPYRVTTYRQRIGQTIFTAMWLPLFMLVIGLMQLLANDEGIVPGWLAKLQGLLHEYMWITYDVFYLKMFGDGERTIGDD